MANRRLLIVLLVLSILGSGRLLGQDRQRIRSRVSARDLLQGEPAAKSLQALEGLVVGHEVVVIDQHGRRRRGRVVAISAGSIVLESPVIAGVWEAAFPLYFPLDLGLVLKRRLAGSTDRTFAEQFVARIDIVDPAGNGTAIGTAVGLSLASATYLWERRQPPGSLKGLATSLALVLGVPVSVRMGHVIDRLINDPIYERTTRGPRASIVPQLGDGSRGITLVIAWR